MTNVVDLGTLDDVAESVLYDPPLRWLKASAAGNITVTLHGDDTTVSAKKLVLTLVSGEQVGTHAIRKIWATGTTIAVGNLKAAR